MYNFISYVRKEEMLKGNSLNVYFNSLGKKEQIKFKINVRK